MEVSIDGQKLLHGEAVTPYACHMILHLTTEKQVYILQRKKSKYDREPHWVIKMGRIVWALFRLEITANMTTFPLERVF